MASASPGMHRSFISHYEILEKIGEGGYGTVFKARDLHVPRLVALKFVYSDLLGSEQAIRRFQEEARVVCALSHPNIVVLHDFDTDADTGRVFLVLEYLSGGTLRDLVQQSTRRGLPLSPFELCRCAAAMASGLGYAHRHGVTHRDVKSSNVMFSDERVVKITDFGLAKSDSRREFTEPGRNPGTLYYMSPEQARGLDVDPRTDIFSLGVVIYEMATGRLPFTAPHSYEVLQKIVSESTPSLKPVRPDLPEELDRIVQRATAKQPEERYQRMEEMEAELADLADRLKHLSERPTESILAAPRGKPWRRRLAWIAALAAALTMAVIAMLWTRANRETPGAAPRTARLLAVIPFDCLGRDESHKAFCEGLAHTLAMKFTQMEPFQNRVLVVPYSEVRREGVTSAAGANKLFKVNLALTGSVEFSGDHVRVIVNLVDAEKKVQMASRKLDSSAQSLARLQDDTSDLAAGMLELRLTAANRQLVAAGQTRNDAAFQAFARGVGYLSRGNEIDNVRQATALLEEAVKLDPSYALAHAQLGEAYYRQYLRTDEVQWFDRARASSDQALKINGRLAPAHITAARLWLARSEPERAVEALKLALRLEPKNAEALRGLGNAYTDLAVRKRDPARKKEALDTFRQAIAIRPELWTTYRDLGLAYLRMGDKPKADESFRRMLELTESADAYRNAGSLCHLMDRPQEAIAYLQKSIAIRPTPEAYTSLGAVYYYLKRYDEMIPNFENAIRLSEETRTRNHVVWGNLGMAYLRKPGMEAKGRQAYREAIRIAETKLHASPKHADTHASLAYYQAQMNDRAGALRHARQAQDLAPGVASILFRCTLVYEHFHLREQAWKTLKSAIEKGHPMKEVLNAGELAALRQDPRFQKYLNVNR